MQHMIDTFYWIACWCRTELYSWTNYFWFEWHQLTLNCHMLQQHILWHIFGTKTFHFTRLDINIMNSRYKMSSIPLVSTVCLRVVNYETHWSEMWLCTLWWQYNDVGRQAGKQKDKWFSNKDVKLYWLR